MKKTALLVAICLLISILGSVTITTKAGMSYKGDIIDVIGDQYHIKTPMGKIVVFKEEITMAKDDAGFDVTDAVLAMVPKALDPQPVLNKERISNLGVIAAPLWVLAIATVAYYAWSVERANNPKHTGVVNP